jgi:hypothetical protein
MAQWHWKHAEELTRADTPVRPVRPYTDAIARLVGAHRYVRPIEAGRKMVTYTHALAWH